MKSNCCSTVCTIVVEAAASAWLDRISHTLTLTHTNKCKHTRTHTYKHAQKQTHTHKHTQTNARSNYPRVHLQSTQYCGPGLWSNPHLAATVVPALASHIEVRCALYACTLLCASCFFLCVRLCVLVCVCLFLCVFVCVCPCVLAFVCVCECECV